MNYPTTIRRKLSRGYRLKASFDDYYVLTGDGWWWFVDVGRGELMNSDSLDNVKRAFSDAPPLYLEDLKEVTLGTTIRETIPTDQGVAYVNPQNHDECLVQLTRPVFGKTWLLVNSVGQGMLFETSEEALDVMSGYDWNRNWTENQPVSHGDYWLCLNNSELSSQDNNV